MKKNLILFTTLLFLAAWYFWLSLLKEWQVNSSDKIWWSPFDFNALAFSQIVYDDWTWSWYEINRAWSWFTVSALNSKASTEADDAEVWWLIDAVKQSWFDSIVSKDVSKPEYQINKKSYAIFDWNKIYFWWTSWYFSQFVAVEWRDFVYTLKSPIWSLLKHRTFEMLVKKQDVWTWEIKD